jgi:hypothetical protein
MRACTCFGQFGNRPNESDHQLMCKATQIRNLTLDFEPSVIFLAQTCSSPMLTAVSR